MKFNKLFTFTNIITIVLTLLPCIFMACENIQSKDDLDYNKNSRLEGNNHITDNEIDNNQINDE